MRSDERQRTRLPPGNTERQNKHNNRDQERRHPGQENKRLHHHLQRELHDTANQDAVPSLPKGSTPNKLRPHLRQQQWKPFNRASYQERLRHWEARELEMATRNAKRDEEQKQEILRRVAWATADAKFHEGYDDRVSDSQFYSGASLRIKRENFDKEKFLDYRDYFDEKKELMALKSRLETSAGTGAVNGYSGRLASTSSSPSSEDDSSCSRSSDSESSSSRTTISRATTSRTSDGNRKEVSMRRAGRYDAPSRSPSRNDRIAPSVTASSCEDTGESSLWTPPADPGGVGWRPPNGHRRAALIVTTITADSTTIESAWWC
ncbi:RNA-binding protein 25-like [Ixodes scapularis]